ncbi:MAG: adenylate/guanylate cyclase domain-containing protein [Anaerolineae bacterium]
MNRLNLNAKEHPFRKILPRPSLKLWLIAPLIFLFLLLLVILLVSYLQTGRVSAELLLISIVSLALFVGPALLVARNVVRRLERIIRAAEQVAQGNLTIHIDDESADEIGQLMRAFNEMVENLHHLEQGRDLLSRTMSPAVRQSLLERGLDFRGMTQIVSILFIDVRDFTRITESHHSTEQLVFFLNDYYTTIANQVHIGGGIIGKYGGDSILAYFGAPNPETPTNSATAAFLTALALQESIEELSDRWTFLGLPPIEVGIGLSIGQVVAGPVGSEQQFEYTVIGDSVNLAYRLQGLTRNVTGYSIILSVEVYQTLEERIKDQIPVAPLQQYEAWSAQEKARRPMLFVDLGEVLVKGKKEPVQVYGIPDYRQNPLPGPTNGQMGQHALERR